MPLMPLDAVVPLLDCPACGSSLRGSVESLRCASDNCQRVYPAVGSNSTPILIDCDASIVDVSALLKTDAASQINRSKGRLGRLAVRLTRQRNKTAERLAQRLTADLIVETKDRRPRLLIVGGGAVGNGIESLYADRNLDIVAFDIYKSDQCQFIADGHQIPLRDGSVDGVLVQAVLEHVLEPQRVVDEIHRVLRPDGLVYADTPFMQQVHEGPYDFTRFTESGHRYLFRRFEVRSSGATGGLGTQLYWSLFYLGRGIHRRVGQVLWAGFSWLHLLDGLLDPRATVDGASGVFFYGQSSTRSISPQEIVAYYSGAQRQEDRGRERRRPIR
jgi:SAM-dependent methyltransferase